MTKPKIQYDNLQIREYNPEHAEIIIQVNDLDEARVIANLLEAESQ